MVLACARIGALTEQGCSRIGPKNRRGEVILLRRYLSIISLLLFSLFIIFGFITPIEVNGTSEIGDIVVTSLIIISFLTALFKPKREVKSFSFNCYMNSCTFPTGLGFTSDIQFFYYRKNRSNIE